MTADQLAERVAERFPDRLVARGEVTVVVERDRLVETLAWLREELGLGWLSDLSCSDWPGREPRIWMAYHLRSLDDGHALRVKVGVPSDDQRLPTATGIHATANWHEREVYDMFGVTFDGHPDLRRILMPPEWEGHPLRKDHPLGGVRTQYKGAFVPPPDERAL